MKDLLNNIYFNSYFLYPKILLLLDILAMVMSLFFLFMCIILFLDNLYRPNIPQYPFNLILDRLIPIIFIISPFFIILQLNLINTPWIEKFGLIILVHLFILIPIMYYWSHNRNWNTFEKKLKYNAWSDPKLYLEITIVMIYPAIWGIYFSCLRYLRLGNEITFYSDIIPHLVTPLILLIFLWPFMSIWIRLILWLIIDIRLFLWNKFYNFILSLSIFILKYKIIFIILEKIYIFSFLWITYIIHHPYIYKKYPRNRIRRLLHLIYKVPVILLFIIVITCLLELLYTKGTLYYSLYLIIIILLLKPVVFFLNTFNGPQNDWITICCYSNFIHSRWDNSYYPQHFWLRFNEMRQEIGNINLSLENNEHIQNTINLHKEKRNKNTARSYKLITKICNKKNTKFKYRLFLVYRQWTSIV